MLFPGIRDKYAPDMNAVMRSQAILVSAHVGRLALSVAIASLLAATSRRRISGSWR